MLRYIFTFCLFVLQTESYGQIDSLNRLAWENHYDYLCAASGQWTANNPNVAPDDSKDFTHFLLRFHRADLLSIQAEVKGVNGQGDTLLFWQVWEFFSPHQQQNQLIQRSSWEVYALGRTRLDENGSHWADVVMYLPDGQSKRHRDIHHIKDINWMQSKTYHFDEPTATWVEDQQLDWYRSELE